MFYFFNSSLIVILISLGQNFYYFSSSSGSFDTKSSTGANIQLVIEGEPNDVLNMEVSI